MRSEEQKQLIVATLQRNLWSWKVKVTKVKAVYHVLSMLHSEGRNFVGECWVPTSEIGTVQCVFNKASVRYNVPETFL
jgi:V-type H+-transporting ATPase subunit a